MAVLLVDIGNTHTHLGWGDTKGVGGQAQFATPLWDSGRAVTGLRRFLKGRSIEGMALSSVVPRHNAAAAAFARSLSVEFFQLSARSVRGMEVDYPRPGTIGADRLANALAVRHHYGAPSMAVDFGTAVTCDVVDRRGCYIGGVIAPGVNVMTDYLHEKTALLPRIRIRKVNRAIGRSTKEAMLIGVAYGYRGLVRELVREVQRVVGAGRLPVVATGSYARWAAAGLPEITAVELCLTLEGLRLAWMNRSARPVRRVRHGHSL